MMAANLEKVINLLGVVIPNWQNKEEKEKGDDMGLVNLSASELGLTLSSVSLSGRQASHTSKSSVFPLRRVPWCHAAQAWPSKST